jgi:hypothetical protein
MDFLETWYEHYVIGAHLKAECLKFPAISNNNMADARTYGVRSDQEYLI